MKQQTLIFLILFIPHSAISGPIFQSFEGHMSTKGKCSTRTVPFVPNLEVVTQEFKDDRHCVIDMPQNKYEMCYMTGLLSLSGIAQCSVKHDSQRNSFYIDFSVKRIIDSHISCVFTCKTSD
ncbi:hypothetical protein [Zhongshania marina]|uniref:Uncharacterized protein n=1 Tax=Zhongshania marina TaxID=2304603 RepID=A0A2S4HF79_9GAMM|nr:hypothetical protein [Marortus luteolus]POP52610.1 hypothetical protein C0068_11065 [Marortus luteolus]